MTALLRTRPISLVQINALTEIVELVDEGFKYTVAADDKRRRTFDALERRGLITLDTIEGTYKAYLYVHPTIFGRNLLEYLK